VEEGGKEDGGHDQQGDEIVGSGEGKLEGGMVRGPEGDGGGVDVEGAVDGVEGCVDEGAGGAAGELDEGRKEVGEEDDPDCVFAGLDEAGEGEPVAEAEADEGEEEAGPGVEELEEAVDVDEAGGEEVEGEEGDDDKAHDGVERGGALPE
jgi:hypothetical protein